jgi:hypothetical protein
MYVLQKCCILSPSNRIGILTVYNENGSASLYIRYVPRTTGHGKATTIPKEP